MLKVINFIVFLYTVILNLIPKESLDRSNKKLKKTKKQNQFGSKFIEHWVKKLHKLSFVNTQLEKLYEFQQLQSRTR